MVESIQYHAFWNKLENAPKVVLECLDPKYKSWSKIPLVKMADYEYPVGEFPAIDADRMLAVNGKIFRHAKKLNVPQSPKRGRKRKYK